MADLSLAIEEEFLTCQICLEIFTEPKILPCLHTFCLKCIEQHFNKTKTGNRARCPLCREYFVAPRGLLQNIKTNFYINSLAEVVKTRCKASKQCSFCYMNDINTSAEWFCIECRDFLCEKCKINHGGTRLTYSHQVISINDLLTGNYDKCVRKTYKITCPRHENEPIKFFCDTCLIPVCQDCVLLDHKKCEYLSLSDALAARRSEIDKLLETGKTQMKRLETKKQWFDSKIQTLNGSEACQIELLKTYGRELKETIDKTLKETEDEIKKVAQTSRYELTERQSAVNHELETIQKPLEFCSELMKNGRDEEILYFRDTLKEGLSNMKNEEETSLAMKWNQTDVLLSDEIAQIVKENAVKLKYLVFEYRDEKQDHSGTVGSKSKLPDDFLRKQTLESKGVSLTSECCELHNSSGKEAKIEKQSTTESKKSPIGNNCFKLVRKFNCFMESIDTLVPEPTGVAWVRNSGNMEIAICDGENGKVKGFAADGSINWFIHISDPMGIAAIGNVIGIAKVDGVTIYRNGNMTNNIAYGPNTFIHIATAPSNMLLFGNNKDEVRIYDNQGRRQGTIHLESVVQPLAVSCNERLLVVSDKQRSETLVFDYNGTIVRSIEKDGCKWLPDAHSVREDKIYFLDRSSRKVYIIRDDFKYLGGWSTEPEITAPCCIDYHPDGFLVVGGAGGNIAIYECIYGDQ